MLRSISVQKSEMTKKSEGLQVSLCLSVCLSVSLSLSLSHNTYAHRNSRFLLKFFPFATQSDLALLRGETKELSVCDEEERESDGKTIVSEK